ncbi:hypothetical protein PG994_008731 [Apiospora phragmitis]|uniref:Uncharacterized protein n=1 Tax=Apiospora phragmitis TaxID=2905665 RepID=A0ABR1UHC0_9PEZI
MVSNANAPTPQKGEHMASDGVETMEKVVEGAGAMTIEISSFLVKRQPTGALSGAMGSKQKWHGTRQPSGSSGDTNQPTF